MRHLAAKAFATVLFTVLAILGTGPGLHAQSHAGCSNATLSGSFGYTNNGSIVAGPDAGPFAGVGRQTFDGKGSTKAAATVSVNGNVIQVTISGTYSVSPDCTGSMILTVSGGPEVFTNHVNFVIVRGGAEMRAINTDPGAVVTTIAEKQFLDQ